MTATGFVPAADLPVPPVLFWALIAANVAIVPAVVLTLARIVARRAAEKAAA